MVGRHTERKRDDFRLKRGCFSEVTVFCVIVEVAGNHFGVVSDLDKSLILVLLCPPVALFGEEQAHTLTLVSHRGLIRENIKTIMWRVSGSKRSRAIMSWPASFSAPDFCLASASISRWFGLSPAGGNSSEHHLPEPCTLCQRAAAALIRGFLRFAGFPGLVRIVYSWRSRSEWLPDRCFLPGKPFSFRFQSNSWDELLSDF